MAATNFTPIQLYRTTTASAVPTAGNLADGELALNLTDERLYFKNAGGAVKLLASNAGSSGDVVAASNNAFTGANTFFNATGQTFGTATSTQDGIVLAGRAGGASSFRVTFQPTTLTASRTLTLPDATTTLVGTDATQTLSNKTISGASNTITNISLTTGVAGTLPVGNGGTGATTLTGVVIGNGTSAFTVKTNPTGAFVGDTDTQTLTNKTLTTPVLSATAAGTTAGQVGYNAGVVTFGNGTATRTLETLEDAQTISGAKTFTAANSFQNASGQTFLASTTTAQDGVVLTGRAGGTSSFRVTLAPGTLTASRAVTLPDAAGTVVLDSATQTLTAKTLSAATLSGTTAGSDGLLTRVMLQDAGWDWHDSGTTNALDFVNGSNQRWAPNTGAQTLSITNWPPSGNLGELLIEGVNLGAATITWPTVNWINPDGTTTTTASTYFSNAGRTLKTSGTDFIFLWTRDAGTTIYGKVV